MIDLARLDVSSPVSYLVAVLLPALDALIPVLPSETAVIALGVATAGGTDPRIAVLVGLAALGAFLGDNAAYLVGRRFGPAVSRRVFAGERGKRRRDWAQRSLARYGVRIIVACRFIPGGRTAVTLACGLTGYPRGGPPDPAACNASGRPGPGRGVQSPPLTRLRRPTAHLPRRLDAPYPLHMFCRRTPPGSLVLLRKDGRAYAPAGTPSEGDELGGARTRGERAPPGPVSRGPDRTGGPRPGRTSRGWSRPHRSAA